ncbi:MAG: methyltransferase domain-containing protein [Actinomycetota bacterium]|nr:methyltransferase domain-containing protein [Actinomycetota bacterium]
MSSQSEIKHPIFARFYIWMSRGRDHEVEHRRALLADAGGNVIEIGAGTGLNFPHYPRSVEHVLAVEPEPTLRSEAGRVASRAPVDVQVVAGKADALPAGDGEFDAAVASLVLCSVPDQAEALAEIRRVVKPGGELRFYEHVTARNPRSARLMRLADATFWPFLGAGCHMSRDTEAAITTAGFTIEAVERFSLSPGPPVPPLPHIRGLARRL